MTTYRAYTNEVFNELLPWSLEDGNWIFRGTYDGVKEMAQKTKLRVSGFVIMRESNEHLDFIEEVEL